MPNVVPSDKEVAGHVVLRINDPSHVFHGISYYYEGMKFAEDENPDGSLNMSFDYIVVDGDIPDDKKQEFEQYIGDELIAILEDQIKRDEVIFKGGVDE